MRVSTIVRTAFSAILSIASCGLVLAQCTQPCVPGPGPDADIKASYSGTTSDFLYVPLLSGGTEVTFTASGPQDIDLCGDAPSYCYDELLVDQWSVSDSSIIELVDPYTPAWSATFKFKQAGTYYYYWSGYTQLSPAATGWVKTSVHDAGGYAHDGSNLLLPDRSTYGGRPARVIVDATKPETPVVTDDGVYTTSTGSLHATWTSSDTESGISKYEYAIGTSSGGTDVVDWTDRSTYTSVTRNLTLTNGATYYFSVRATNRAGMVSDVGVSDGIAVTTSRDAEDQFALGGNPNGEWAYGYSANLNPGYSLTLYNLSTTHSTAPLTGLQRRYGSLGNDPSVTHNPTGQSITDGTTTWPAHALAITPGPSGQKSIARWTATSAGMYTVSARFLDITDGHTSTDVHVMHNGAPLFEADITNLNEGPAPLADRPEQWDIRDIDMAANDTLDFVVGYGNDSDYASDTTGFEVRIVPAVDTTAPTVDRGLPGSQSSYLANINEASGLSRSNVRWASPDPAKAYGDDFTLPDGGEWIVDTIRVWTVPAVPMIPAYCIGRYYQSITLYGGPASGGLSALSTGSLDIDSNIPSNRNTFVRPIVYANGQSYVTAAGENNQLWQIDFSNLNLAVNGGTAYAFAVVGAPRVDRSWFNHAMNGALSGWTDADNQLRWFDLGNPGAGTTPTGSTDNGSGWFADKPSDMTVQVFAHRKTQ
jgi:hypothetical protein